MKEENIIITFPIHPLLVHFPIALFLFGVLIQIIVIWKPAFYDKMATYLFLGGVVSGIPTYLTGKLDEDYAEDYFGDDVKDIIEIHETLGVTTLIVFSSIVLIKLTLRDKKSIRILVIVLSLIGAGLISFTGHLGGQIVYNDQQLPSLQIDDLKFEYEND
ncbi:DUF2231 domain-containing protein [Pseudalkalibacillus sp. R45]|uniref:DUF2231 domain-containing protein n=1 Tax=Pseudalkalibacillus sp. R45 TaxID=3457433 RepID=UPI003FCE4485